MHETVPFKNATSKSKVPLNKKQPFFDKQGTSINTSRLEHDMHPIVYAGDVPNTREGYNESISR